MTESRLKEVTEEVYSEDTVEHMLSEEKVPMVLRAYILVHSAIMNKIISTLIDKGEFRITGLAQMYKDLTGNNLTEEELFNFSESDIFQ